MDRRHAIAIALWKVYEKTTQKELGRDSRPHPRPHGEVNYVCCAPNLRKEKTGNSALGVIRFAVFIDVNHVIIIIVWLF